MSKYPKIYKVEAVVSARGRVYVVLYDVSSGWDFTPEYRDAQGPNFMFDFDISDSRCPGFWTLVKQARAREFEDWEDLPFVNKIVDGEAAAQYAYVVDERYADAIVATWTGNAKKPTVHNTKYYDWATK